MSKINYTSHEFLVYYKEHFEEEFLPDYLNLDGDKIKQTFAPELHETNHDFDYQPLINPTSDQLDAKLVFENSQRIYGMMPDLSIVEATKEELWFAMINTYFLDYLLAYVKQIKGENDVIERIKNAIFFNHGPKQSLLIQHLAKFWWIGYRTYDDQATKDPYWLTEFFTETDPTAKALIFYQTDYTNNKELALGIIAGIKELADAGKVENNFKTFEKVDQYFNEIGGLLVLDTFTRQEMKQKTIEFLS